MSSGWRATRSCAYCANLTRFIREARAHGATPILATPVARRRWDAAGQLVDTHGAYPEAMRAVAELEKVPLLELNRLTTELEKAHGPEGSKKLHLWIEPGVYTRKPGGYKDDTHFSAYGATAVATLELPVIEAGLEANGQNLAATARSLRPGASPPAVTMRQSRPPSAARLLDGWHGAVIRVALSRQW